METIKINGIAYEVMAQTTADDMAAKGMVNAAAMMQADRKTRLLSLRRPKGQINYFAIEFLHPVYGIHYSNPISLGR